VYGYGYGYGYVSTYEFHMHVHIVHGGVHRVWRSRSRKRRRRRRRRRRRVVTDRHKSMNVMCMYGPGFITALRSYPPSSLHLDPTHLLVYFGVRDRFLGGQYSREADDASALHVAIRIQTTLLDRVRRRRLSV
jgi:hypothetical protein